MEKFFNCLMLTIGANGCGAGVLMSTFWAVDTFAGAGIYSAIESIPTFQRLLLTGVVFLGGAIGSAFWVYRGQFVDHKKFVSDSHWVHRNDIT